MHFPCLWLFGRPCSSWEFLDCVVGKKGFISSSRVRTAQKVTPWCYWLVRCHYSAFFSLVEFVKSNIYGKRAAAWHPRIKKNNSLGVGHFILVPWLCLEINSWQSLCINSHFISLFLRLAEERTVWGVCCWLGHKCCHFMLHSLLGLLLETGAWGELDFLVLSRAVGVVIIWVEAGMIFHLWAQLYNSPCAQNSCLVAF